MELVLKRPAPTRRRLTVQPAPHRDWQWKLEKEKRAKSSTWVVSSASNNQGLAPRSDSLVVANRSRSFVRGGISAPALLEPAQDGTSVHSFWSRPAELWFEPARVADGFLPKTFWVAADFPSSSRWGRMKHVPRVNVDSSMSKVLAIAQSSLADRFNHHPQDIQQKGNTTADQDCRITKLH
jgi:hypothetical protein